MQKLFKVQIYYSKAQINGMKFLINLFFILLTSITKEWQLFILAFCIAFVKRNCSQKQNKKKQIILKLKLKIVQDVRRSSIFFYDVQKSYAAGRLHSFASFLS